MNVIIQQSPQVRILETGVVELRIDRVNAPVVLELPEQGPPGGQGPRGLQGLQGVPGTNGTNGSNGLSAYELALLNGFEGTEAEWLASLVGPAGNDGAGIVAAPETGVSLYVDDQQNGTYWANTVEDFNQLPYYKYTKGWKFLSTESATSGVANDRYVVYEPSTGELAYRTSIPDSALSANIARLTGNTFTAGQVIQLSGTSTIPLIVRGGSGQTASLFEARVFSGNPTVQMLPTGKFQLKNPANNGSRIGVFLTYDAGGGRTCDIASDDSLNSFTFNPSDSFNIVSAPNIKGDQFQAKGGSYLPLPINFFDAGSGVKGGCRITNGNQPSAGISTFTSYQMSVQDSGGTARLFDVFAGFSDTTAASYKTAVGMQSTDTSTSTVSGSFLHRHNSSGTPSAGFGSSYQFQLQTSTTTNQPAVDLTASWATATHASRMARFTISSYDTAAREGIRVEASGSETMLGFYGVNAVARQVLATGAGRTVDDIITALQNLGLVKQS